MTMIVTLIPAYSLALPQAADYIRILPEIVLSVFGIIVMVLDPLLEEAQSQKILGIIAFARHAGRTCGDLVHGAVSGPRLLEHGAGRRLQRLLSFPGDRHRRRRHPQFVTNTWRCSGFAPVNTTR